MAKDESSETTPRGVLETRESNYAGGLLINTRTITRSGDVFERILRGRTANNRITLAEFGELLVLLESIAASGDLYYDGTVPEAVKEKVGEAEHLIEQNAKAGDLFNRADAGSEDELLDFCREGASQAAPLLKQRMVAFSESPDDLPEALQDIQPFTGSSDVVAEFRRAMTGIPKPQDERTDYCKDIIRRDFNGAKCVAGILALDLAGDENPDGVGDVRRDCHDFVATFAEDEEKLRLIIPLFMNSFRANYLNSLASDKLESAFFSGPDTRKVLDRQVLIYSAYVARRVGDDLWVELGDDVAHLMTSKATFPFMGLLTFLSGTAGDPFSLFHVALNDKEQIASEFFAQQGGQTRFVHQMNADELNEFTMLKLEGIYRKHQARFRLNKSLLDINDRYVFPIFKALRKLKAGLEVVEIFRKLAIGELPDGSGVSAPQFPEMDQFTLDSAINTATVRGEMLKAAVFTSDISTRVGQAMQDPDLSTLVARRVESILGLELVRE